ncbi:hypothetical protein OLX02_03930 [Novosphingobium sp. KCTC 2891]|uniref:hypothetical protein n=1 Tax=Novosphingobium sp. KCTC 2891 TaxID=2989730 RepID=UPI00222374E4|nr:hypothetical protein [Novosphingobium sp. KCTC 2891]MCW1381964.1 hypothetical protein [Novosphingobium sp. KCTC 2891]
MTKLLGSSIALATLLAAGSAHAGSIRSRDALPSVSYAGKQSEKFSDRSLPTHVGPKKGWRDNHGLENAYEHSNEHSAHHRNDSDG